jgi:hypothetical protein
LGEPMDSSEGTQDLTPLPDLEDIKMGYENYILAKGSIPIDGFQFANGVVKRRVRDQNGEPIPTHFWTRRFMRLSWRMARSSRIMLMCWPSTSTTALIRMDIPPQHST